MIDFKQLTVFALEQRASDIHIATNVAPRIRVDGDVREVRISPLSKDEVFTLLDSIMTDSQKEEYRKELELDFSIATDPQIRFRVNAFYTVDGPSAVFRAIPMKIKSLKEIEAPSVIESLTLLPKGLILVTGPSGSGKSTTLAAFIEHINLHHEKHIITIEDPIEFLYKSKKSLINQREVGSSTKSYARALKSALREDPDIILIGEIRDLETMSLALTAAETGHLVLGTLHTSSAAQSINRVIDVFPTDAQPMIRSMLTTSLEAVISQRLIKRSENNGRVATYEIMIATSAVRNLIKENKIPQIASVIQLGAKDGMMLMSDHVQKLINDGAVTLEDANELLKSSDELIREQIDHRNKINRGITAKNNDSINEDEDF